VKVTAQFRVVALSATPGSDIKVVAFLISNRDNNGFFKNSDFYLHSCGRRPVNRTQLCECCSKTVQHYNIHTQYKNPKHENVNRPKFTAGLSIKLSIDVEGLIRTETLGYKRLVLVCT